MSDDKVPRCRCDVILEQTLGHVTHGQNLQRLLPRQERLQVTFVEVQYDLDGWARRLPPYRNWTVRAGLRARKGLHQLGRHHGRDALFVHSQVPAVLLGQVMTRVPTVVSLDATPKQYDELGEHYAHETGSRVVESTKTWLNRRCFDRAARLVTWSEWTKQSLVDDYGVDPDKVTVIPPGVDLERWTREPPGASGPGEPVRILFVGGNLVRKGGHELLTAFAELRSKYGSGAELHVVSPDHIPSVEGVSVHARMTPNSPELIELYHRCHVFCLPTRGDCLPMVLPEAAAAGLALVSTDVGAISEIVRDGETGLLVPVNQPELLHRALERLVSDSDLRTRLATNGSSLVREKHDAAVNATLLGDVICDVACQTDPHQVD
jgi:glycosyltransferase involved in cell wall biosynthesis